MTGSTPPRKAGRGVAGDDVEDAWLAAEAAKRSHARAAPGWGVRVRGHFNTFLLLLLALLAFLAVSVGTRSGNAGAPPQAPPVTLPFATTNKGNNATDQSQAPVSSTVARNRNGVHTPTTIVRATTKKGKGADEPRASTTVLLPSDDDTGAIDDGGRQVPGEQPAECDMSSGRWVYDDKAYPLYKESACKFMSDQAACQKFGRTDLRYQHWRWQPHGCDLPRYDVVYVSVSV